MRATYWKTQCADVMCRRCNRQEFSMQLTGGQALARQLVLEGITDVFGVPGVQLDWAVDGLREVSDRVRYLVTRHEQAASYMADGYAPTPGPIGASLVVPRPALPTAMPGPPSPP